MIIRQEMPSDYETVYNLVKISFETTPDDGTTPNYLNDIRQKDVFIPELSLVTEIDGILVGQIVLYKTAIIMPSGAEHIELLLSPICVHPNYFRQGIARTMVDEALYKAAQMGYRAVFLCGDPEIYSKLGFVPTYRYDIFHKDDAAAEWSMMRKLFDGALDGITGTIDTV